MNENLLTTVVPGAIIVISLPICSAMNLASRDNTPSRGVIPQSSSTTVDEYYYNIAGIYLLHTGIAVSVGIYYLGTLAGFGNTLYPLLKHQDKNLSQPVTQPTSKT